MIQTRELRPWFTAALGLAAAGLLSWIAAVNPLDRPQPVSLRGLGAAELAGLGIAFSRPPPRAVQAFGQALIWAGIHPVRLPDALQPLPELDLDPRVAEAFALGTFGPRGRVLDTQLLVARQVHELPPGASCGGPLDRTCYPLVTRGPSAWLVVVARGPTIDHASGTRVQRRIIYFMDPQERGGFHVELPA